MRDFQKPGRSAAFSTKGMCATSHPLAARVAVSLLEDGANAVDAAIAAAILLGFCEPQSTGIGGDLFAMVSKPGSDEIIGLNASGRAPAGLNAADLRAKGHKTVPLYDAAAVTVPGAVDGFCRLHADHGKLPLADVLAPAIHYADEGIPIAPRVAFDYAAEGEILSGEGSSYFLDQGKPLPLGHIFRAPKQAEVLRRIAKEGRAGFYEGEVAEDMVASLNALGGTHTLEDFAATACDYVTPLRSPYRDAELIELPPNGQGATAILIANILSHFDIANMDPFGTERAHIETEAVKLGYDARNRFIADPDHMSRLEHMTSMDTAKALADLIDPSKAAPDAHKLSEAVHKDTVYLSVVDADGMAGTRYMILLHTGENKDLGLKSGPRASCHNASVGLDGPLAHRAVQEKPAGRPVKGKAQL